MHYSRLDHFWGGEWMSLQTSDNLSMVLETAPLLGNYCRSWSRAMQIVALGMMDGTISLWQRFRWMWKLKKIWWLIAEISIKRVGRWNRGKLWRQLIWKIQRWSHFNKVDISDWSKVTQFLIGFIWWIQLIEKSDRSYWSFSMF